MIILNSLLFSSMIYYYLTLPSPISQELNFNFSHNNEYLKTELSFVCEKNMIENCKEIENINYQIFLNFDVSNNFVKYSNSENIEIEMKIYSKSKEHSLKRIFFFDKLDDFSDLINKVLLIPFKMLGFFNSKDKEILMIENYDNNKQPLHKLEFLLKNKNLNMNKCYLHLVPIIGIIRRILSHVKFLAAFLFFSSSVLFQTVTYLFLFFIKRKNTFIY